MNCPRCKKSYLEAADSKKFIPWARTEIRVFDLKEDADEDSKFIINICGYDFEGKEHEDLVGSDETYPSLEELLKEWDESATREEPRGWARHPCSKWVLTLCDDDGNSLEVLRTWEPTCKEEK